MRDKIACYGNFMSYMFLYYKKTRKMILIFAIFFKVFFENFCHFLRFLALGVKKPPQGFDKGFVDRLLHSFLW